MSKEYKNGYLNEVNPARAVVGVINDAKEGLSELFNVKVHSKQNEKQRGSE